VDYSHPSPASAPASLKTEEKELPGGEGEYAEEEGVDDGLLCILDVAYAPGEMDQIPVRVGDKASDLAAVRACVCGLFFIR
jgi:hypothetical protein